MSDQHRQLLRHTLATIAYRTAKAIRDAPGDSAGYRPSDSVRTPAEILDHMGDLFVAGRVGPDQAPPVKVPVG